MGGGSDWKLVEETTFSKVYSSTSDSSFTIPITYTPDLKKPYLIEICDTAGPRAGYFYKTYALFIQHGTLETSFACAQNSFHYDEDGNLQKRTPTQVSSTTGGYGIYVNFYRPTANMITLMARYNATYSGTIDGTYSLKIYESEFPNGYPDEAIAIS